MKRAPLYFQIYEILHKRIVSGVYPVGSILPTEAELGHEFSVSRTTIRKAMEMLAQESYVTIQQGSGTKVSSRSKITQQFNYVTSLLETFREQGATIEAKEITLDKTEADDELAHALQLKQGASVYRLKRLIEADGRPVASITNFLVPAFVPNIENKIHLMRSLYRFLEELYDLEIESATDRISARNPTQAEAERLQLSLATPVMVIKRTGAARGKLFYFSETIVNSSNYEIGLFLKGRPPRS